MNDELKEILNKKLLEKNNFLLSALVQSDANAVKEILKNKGFSCEESELKESEIKSFLNDVLLKNMGNGSFVIWFLAGINEQVTRKRKRDDAPSTSAPKKCWSVSLIHLKAAIEHRDYSTVEYLLENNLVNVQPDAMETEQRKEMTDILHTAFDSICYYVSYENELLPEDTMFLDILLYYGADINLTVSTDHHSGETLLHREIRVMAESLGEGVCMYEENPALTSDPDIEGWRELKMHPRLENCTRVADYLISKGANINKLDMDGESPLLRILWGLKSWPLIKYLLTKGANPNLKTRRANRFNGNKMGQNAFHRTIEVLTGAINTDYDNGFDVRDFPKAPDVYLKEIITTFLFYKTNVNAQDNQGNSPLHLAIHAYDAWRNYEEPLYMDGDAIADTDATADATVNHFYRESIPFNKIIEIFMEHNANVDLQDENGNTPLHLIMDCYKSWVNNINRNHEHLGEAQRKQRILSLIKEQEEIITAFLHAGADINLKNHSGKLPLQVDCESVALKVVLLKEDWVMESTNYHSFFQWLPREMEEDVVNWMYRSTLAK